MPSARVQLCDYLARLGWQCWPVESVLFDVAAVARSRLPLSRNPMDGTEWHTDLEPGWIAVKLVGEGERVGQNIRTRLLHTIEPFGGGAYVASYCGEADGGRWSFRLV